MQSHLDHEADVLVSPHLSLSHKIIIFIFYFLKYEIGIHYVLDRPHIYILEDTGNNKTGHG